MDATCRFASTQGGPPFPFCIGKQSNQTFYHSQVDQAIALLWWAWSSSERIVILLAEAAPKAAGWTSLSRKLLTKPTLRRSSPSELLLEERIIPRLRCPQPINTSSCRINECARS